MAYNYTKVDKAKLLKAGFEGFEMLEEEYLVTKRQQKTKKASPSNSAWPSVSTAANCIYQYQPQQTLVYQVMNPASATAEMINSFDAVKLHDGRLVLDYSRRKSAAVAY